MSMTRRAAGLLAAAGAWGLLLGGCRSESGRAPEADARTARAEVASPGGPSSITAAELLARLAGEDAPVVLDVRSPEEFSQGHVPGAVNIPYDRIEASLDSLDAFRGREVVVYCRTGRRAGIAEARLQEAGFEAIRDLDGHMQGWLANDLPVVVPAGECC